MIRVVHILILTFSVSRIALELYRIPVLGVRHCPLWRRVTRHARNERKVETALPRPLAFREAMEAKNDRGGSAVLLLKAFGGPCCNCGEAWKPMTDLVFIRVLG